MRSGFTLLETLVALAILALASLLVMGRAAQGLEQVGAHTAQLDFQTAVSALRRQAFRDQAAITVVSDAKADAEGEPKPVGLVLPMPPGWSYRLSQPLAIGAGGACGTGQAELLHDGRVRAVLEAAGADCRFLRLR